MKYILTALKDAYKIAELDKKTIDRVRKEKSLEEIFLSNLFINYFIIMIIFALYLIIGEFKISNYIIYNSNFLGVLLLYPFFYNLVIFCLYSIFGLSAEIIDNKKHLRPILSIGFHKSLLFSFVVLFIFLLLLFNSTIGLLLIVLYILYFLINMFAVIKYTYKFSIHKAFIVVLNPILFFSLILLILSFFYPNMLLDFILIFY